MMEETETYVLLVLICDTSTIILVSNHMINFDIQNHEQFSWIFNYYIGFIFLNKTWKALAVRFQTILKLFWIEFIIIFFCFLGRVLFLKVQVSVEV